MQCLVRQWIHFLRQYSGGFGRISHIFYVAADSNRVPSRRFWLLSCSAQLALGNLEVFFYELHVAAMRDQGPFFGALVSVTGPGGAGVAGSFTPR